jgi:hypothetical protein
MDSIDFTFTVPDHTDTTWFATRELGAPDDPYNANCKKIPKDSPLYAEYVEMAKQLIDELEKDSKTDEKDGWIFVQEKNGVTTHKKENDGDQLLTFRGVTVMQSTPEIIRLWLIQMDQRSFWDPTFAGGTYELEAEITSRVSYNVYSAPWPVSYRDFLVLSSEDIRDDGTLLCGVHSVEHADYPAKDGYVRGTIYSSGFVIKPLPPQNGIPQCKVWYTGTIDIAGWIPTYVANMVNCEQPMNIANLRDLIVTVADLLLDLFIELFRVEESNWTETTLSEIMYGLLDKHGHGDRPLLLFNALNNYFMGKRVGPTEEEVIHQMVSLKKRATMTKLFKGFQHYIPTLARGQEIYTAAKEYFGE